VFFVACEGVHVPKSILIVDDSLLIRKILRETLGREAGWEVCGDASKLHRLL
jgi:chemotaxis response regulator CheB